MNHYIELSNGETVVLEEGRDGLAVCLGDGEGGIDAYIAYISGSSINVYPNSGDAADQLTDGLNDTEKAYFIHGDKLHCGNVVKNGCGHLVLDSWEGCGPFKGECFPTPQAAWKDYIKSQEKDLVSLKESLNNLISQIDIADTKLQEAKKALEELS